MTDFWKKKIFWTEAGELNIAFFIVAFTMVPTLLAILYYSVFASDLYVAKTKFSIYGSESQSFNMNMGAISQITGGNVNASTLDQLLVVADYIQGYDMLKALDESVDVQEKYRSEHADQFSRLQMDPTASDFLSYYQDMIRVKVNRDANIIDVEVLAFEAEDANVILRKINELAEDFVNKMLARIKQDALKEAQSFITKSEDKVKAAQNALSEFRMKNTVIDPTEELNTKLGFIQTLEAKKAEILIEDNQQRTALSANAIAIRNLNSQINNIDELIEKTKDEILAFTSEGKDLLREYEMLILDEGFAKEEYKLALVNLEETIKEQARANKYVVEILKPTKPDVASEPNRILEVLKVMVVSFLFFSVLGLMVAGVRDHIVRY